VGVRRDCTPEASRATVGATGKLRTGSTSPEVSVTGGVVVVTKTEAGARVGVGLDVISGAVEEESQAAKIVHNNRAKTI